MMIETAKNTIAREYRCLMNAIDWYRSSTFEQLLQLKAALNYLQGVPQATPIELIPLQFGRQQLRIPVTAAEKRQHIEQRIRSYQSQMRLAEPMQASA